MLGAPCKKYNANNKRGVLLIICFLTKTPNISFVIIAARWVVILSPGSADCLNRVRIADILGAVNPNVTDHSRYKSNKAECV